MKNNPFRSNAISRRADGRTELSVRPLAAQTKTEESEARENRREWRGMERSLQREGRRMGRKPGYKDDGRREARREGREWWAGSSVVI